LVILHRKSNPDVNAFMADNDISTYEQLESYFIQNVVNLLDTLDSKYLVWEEVFLNGVTLPNSTVVHVWRGGGLETLAAVGFFFLHERQKMNS
jgi:hexosaminidase